MVFDLWARSIVAGKPFDYSNTGHEFFPLDRRTPRRLCARAALPLLRRHQFPPAGVLPRPGSAPPIVSGVPRLCVGLLASRAFPYAPRRPVFVVWPQPFTDRCSFMSQPCCGPVCSISWAVSGLWLLSVAADHSASTWRNAGLAVAAGVALALGVLLRANYLLFALPALGWLAWRRGRSSAVRTATWGLLGLILPLLPVIAVNSIRSGAPAFLSSNGPYIFFVGNVHDASGLSAGPSPYYFEVKASGPPQEVSLLRARPRRHPPASPAPGWPS